MADVAREANVNRITVSRALSHPELVAADTLERIRAAIARTGYIPDQIARGMKTLHSRIVSLVTPPQMSGVHGAVLESLSESLHAVGLIVNLYPLQDDTEQQEAILREIAGWRPAAIVLVGTQLTEADIRTLSLAKVPIVELLGYSETSPGVCVGYDQHEASALLTNHLLDRGYRKICYVHSGRVIGSINKARLDGFQSAIADSGGTTQLRRSDEDCGLEASGNADAPIDRLTGIELKCAPNFRAGHDLMAKLAGWQVRPQAILFGSDMVAVGALQYCQKHGLKLREDVALCAFDGITLTSIIHPGLTSLDFAYEQVIAEGARQIIACVEGGCRAGAHIRIPIQVVNRGST
jgi:LacI family gluconate utilization system Gnt-I transcriptional repressor